MNEIYPPNAELANRILDKLIAGETICFLDFPDVPEATFDRVMAVIEEQLGGHEVH